MPGSHFRRRLIWIRTLEIASHDVLSKRSKELGRPDRRQSPMAIRHSLIPCHRRPHSFEKNVATPTTITMPASISSVVRLLCEPSSHVSSFRLYHLVRSDALLRCIGMAFESDSRSWDSNNFLVSRHNTSRKLEAESEISHRFWHVHTGPEVQAHSHPTLPCSYLVKRTPIPTGRNPV